MILFSIRKKIIIILLYIFSIASSVVYAQNEYKTQKINNSEFILFVDNMTEAIPNEIMDQLNKIPTSEVHDGIIYYLMGTGKYQNVNVKELLNKESKKIIYLITAHYTKKIQAIVFEGISSVEQSSYQKNLNLQVGKIFREYLALDDMKKIEKNIYLKGYPNATVKSYRIKPEPNNLVNLIYTVDKGAPCRIDQIVIEKSYANILNFINLPIESGSLCDVPSINDKLYQIKNSYWRQGYLNAEAKIKDISYSTNKERAKLNLIIEKGAKTTIQIKDENDDFINSDFLNSNQNAITYSDLLSSENNLNELIVDYYKNLGYPFTTITNSEKTVAQNKNTVLKFTIKIGQFVKIGDMFFVGDLPENKANVIDELQLDTSFFSSATPFIQSNLGTYRDKYKNIFLRNGYADAQVPIPDFGFSSNGKQANLVFNAFAGDKYILSEIQIQNLPEGLNLKTRKLSRILKPGDVVNFDNKQAYADEVRTELLRYGYLYTQVKFDQTLEQTDQGTKNVTLIVKVDAGPLVKLGKIHVQGDSFNKAKEIMSISGLEEGDIFTQQLLDSARNHILRHDLFSSVVVEPFDPSALERKEATVDIVIQTRGRQGFLLSLSPGWGTLRGYRFEADYSLNGITRDGLRLISSASVSQEKQQSSFASTDTKQILGKQFNLGFAEPLFKLGPLYTPFDLSAIAGYQVAAETLTNREYQTLKLNAEWKPDFFDYNWNFTTSFIHEKSTSTSSESAVVQTLDSPTLIIRESLNTISLDSRNNKAWPTSGGLFSFGFGMARFGFGSDVEYNRYLPKADIHLPIYKKLSAAIFVGGDFIPDTTNRNGETVTPPASRRATLTDDALIRGFPETFGGAAPGPLLWIHYAPDTGVTNCSTQLASVGGTNLMYLKTEARYRFNDIWGMVAFVDTGESYLTANEVNQVNRQIKSQINPSASTPGQCTVDAAQLIDPNSPNFNDANFFKQYWRQAYVSTGLGLRVILGNIASISLDYGYPLKDPSQNEGNCSSVSDALNANTAPHCVSRIQDTDYNLKVVDIQFKGAIHLGIGAKF